MAWNSGIETLEQFEQWTPLPLVVYCWIEPTPRNKLSTSMLTRVGPARDRAHAEELIAKDKKAMMNTYGGLMEASGISGRHYRVLSATWHKTTGF